MGSIVEDRKTALAVFLCIVAVLVYSELFLRPITTPPGDVPAPVSPRQQVAEQPVAPAPVEPIQPPAGSVEVQAPLPESSTAVHTAPSANAVSAAGFIEIESARYLMKMSLLGGRLTSVKLKEHKEELNGVEYLDLVRIEDGEHYPLGVYAGGSSDINTLYRVAMSTGTLSGEQRYTVPGGGDLKVAFIGSLPGGRVVRKELVVRDDSYLVDVNIAIDGLPADDQAGVSLEWAVHVSEEQAGSQYDPFGFRYLDQEGDVENTAVSDLEENQRDLGELKWITVGDKYYMGAILPKTETGLLQGVIGKRDFLYYMRLGVQGASGAFKIYVGPKEYQRLNRYGYSLQRSVDLGIFAFIALPLMQALHFLFGLIGNYGLAIVALTLLIKLFFLPLTSVSFRSMKAMQDLQPEMKALRERIKDPTRLNQEVMALYKKHGVNPMGGCVPMLIQIPVFLGLYMGLLSTIELRHAPFALWVTDLSAPEALMVFGIPVPVMILLMGISMIMQQWFTPSAMDPQQKKVMMMVPVIFTVMFIVFPFPSGLVLYWLVNNIISIVQQGYLRSEKNVSPLQATLVSSVVLFSFCFVLTLF